MTISTGKSAPAPPTGAKKASAATRGAADAAGEPKSARKGAKKVAKKSDRSYESFVGYVLNLTKKTLAPVPTISTHAQDTLRHMIGFVAESFVDAAGQLAVFRSNKSSGSFSVRKNELNAALSIQVGDRALYGDFYKDMRAEMDAAVARFEASSALVDADVKGGHLRTMRAGLSLPVGRIENKMKDFGRKRRYQISADLPIRLTAALEFVLKRVLRASYTMMRAQRPRDASGNEAHGTGRLDHQHVKRAILTDAPVAKLFEGLKFMSGSIRPTIHGGLVPPPRARPASASAPTAAAPPKKPAAPVKPAAKPAKPAAKLAAKPAKLAAPAKSAKPVDRLAAVRKESAAAAKLATVKKEPAAAAAKLATVKREPAAAAKLVAVKHEPAAGTKRKAAAMA